MNFSSKYCMSRTLRETIYCIHLYPSVEQALPRVIQLKWFPHLIIRNSLLLYLDFVLNDPDPSS